MGQEAVLGWENKFYLICLTSTKLEGVAVGVGVHSQAADGDSQTKRVISWSFGEAERQDLGAGREDQGTIHRSELKEENGFCIFYIFKKTFIS